jgi:hypothetical protein
MNKLTSPYRVGLLGHAGAFALVGWYLMLVPWDASHSPRRMADVPLNRMAACARAVAASPYVSQPGCPRLAPFRQWRIVRPFDTARECLDHEIDIWDKESDDYAFPSCIATDDPRLADLGK